ncbi:MAG: alkaline phosphatase family protein [Candidatus Thorarchaeota archaeon]|nr:alkaline phosphatase family protein [Candidatus Thorarchaeota archaeon]
MAQRHKLLLMGVDQAIPCFINRFVEDGTMPNLARLIERGVRGRALSCFPPDTPTNWVTVATGANVERHGATSFYLHMPGEPFEEGLRKQNRSRSQLRKYATAEFLWDVVDQAGIRSFVVNYPAGWPSVLENGIMSRLVWEIPDPRPRILSPAKIKEVQIESALSGFEIVEGVSARLIEINNEKKYRMVIPEKTEKLEEGEWSSWLESEMKTDSEAIPCICKAKLEDIEKDTVSILIGTVYSLTGWANPDSFGRELIQNVMEPELIAGMDKDVEYWFQGSTADYLEEAEQEARLVGRTVKYAKQKHDWQVCMFHIHFLDSVNHKELAYLHEGSPLYEEEASGTALENVRKAYELIDDLLGMLLDSVVDDDTVVAFLSDHGAIPAWKMANIPKALVDAGLLSYKDENGKTLSVDWSKTKAFAYLEPPYVWVNKVGRDPHGIVEDEEYDSVREKIIEALESMRDPESGKRIVKIALRREEADFLGQNSDRVGDVVFALNPPYELFDGNAEELDISEIQPEFLERSLAFPAAECLGAHAYYLPTTRFGPYSIDVPLILAGPGIKSNVEFENSFNLVDVAPTLAYLLGVRRPKDSQGRILHEILEKFNCRSH